MSRDSSNSVLVGIDFGTTKTYLTYCAPGNDDVSIFGDKVPTAVAFEKPKEWKIGEQAISEPPPGSELTSGFKREIDSTERTRLGWRNAEIAGKFLADLRKRFQRWDRREIKGLTITVPAEWPISARQATLYAARLAGFDCPIALLEEPLAAFLRFYAKEEKRLGNYRATIVFDFGGGTCDISMIDFKSGKPHVVKSKTIHIGGSDIDELIVYYWLKRGHIPYEINKESDRVKKLRFWAEIYKKILSDRVRIELSNMGSVDLNSIYIPDAKHEGIDTSISAQDLENFVRDGVDKDYTPKARGSINFIREGIIPPIRQDLIEFLRTADRDRSIECVVLSGGSCKLWDIQKFLKEESFKERYGKIDFLPSVEDYDTIEKSVARGAALYQYYADRGEQIAIPSLNNTIRVTVSVNGKEFKRHVFDERIDLPTRWSNDIRNGHWGMYLGARGKTFQIKIESIQESQSRVESVKEFNITDITNGISPLGELGWLCSIDEYGLVRLLMSVIDVAKFKLPEKPVYLYPAQEEFDPTDQIELFRLQQELDIYGGEE